MTLIRTKDSDLLGLGNWLRANCGYDGNAVIFRSLLGGKSNLMALLIHEKKISIGMYAWQLGLY